MNTKLFAVAAVTLFGAATVSAGAAEVESPVAGKPETATAAAPNMDTASTDHMSFFNDLASGKIKMEDVPEELVNDMFSTLLADEKGMEELMKMFMGPEGMGAESVDVDAADVSGGKKEL